MNERTYRSVLARAATVAALAPLWAACASPGGARLAPDPVAGTLAAVRASVAISAQEAEKKRAEEKKKEENRWKASFEAGASVAGGNTDRSDFDAELEASRKWAKSELKTYARAEWGETENDDGEEERDRNRQTAGAKYRRDADSSKVYWFVSGDLERDEFKDIQLRSETFAGAGTRAVKNQKHELNVEGGVGVVSTHFFDDDNLDSTDPAGTLSQDWKYVINDAWTLEEKFQIVSNLDEIDDDFRTTFNADLKTDITEKLYLSFGFEHLYDAEPADDTERQDYRAMVRIGVKLF